MLQDFSRRHTQHVIFTPTTLLTLTISLFLWTYYHVFFLSSSRVLGNTLVHITRIFIIIHLFTEIRINVEELRSTKVKSFFSINIQMW